MPRQSHVRVPYVAGPIPQDVKVGTEVLENGDANVASVQGSLLLGQSFLSRFKAWSVDNSKHALVLQ
jgi:predicted aspartyl protease